MEINLKTAKALGVTRAADADPAGTRAGDSRANRAGEGVIVVERQITRGGSLMGYTEAW